MAELTTDLPQIKSNDATLPASPEEQAMTKPSVIPEPNNVTQNTTPNRLAYADTSNKAADLIGTMTRQEAEKAWASSGNNMTGWNMGSNGLWAPPANYVSKTATGTNTGVSDVPAMTDVNSAKAEADRTANSQWTDEEKNRIADAERQAQTQYQEIIDSATRAKDKGLPSSVVAAGQQGGFLNTQFAGMAALLPMDKEGNFIGRGGRLEQIASEYDSNIQSAISQQKNAMMLAKQYAQEAIRTGKSKLLDQAQAQYELALKASAQANDSALKKAQAIAEFNKNAQERAKYIKEELGKTVDTMVQGGFVPSEQDFSDLAKGYNATPDTVKMLYNASSYNDAVKKAKDSGELQKASIESATALWTGLSKLPAGTKVTIDGHAYFGTSGTDKIEVDPQGFGYQWAVDQTTGELAKHNLGYVGNPNEKWEIKVDEETGNVWRINPVTGVASPVSIGEATKNIEKIIPTGSRVVPGGRAPDAPNAGECGATLNDMYDGGPIWKNTLDEKLATLKNIEVPKETVEVNDTVVFGGSGSGHVALVNEVYRDPVSGKVTLRLTESNVVPPKGKTISHSRLVSLDNPNLKGVARVALKPQFISGPDVSTEDQTNISTRGINITSGQLRLGSGKSEATLSIDDVLKLQERGYKVGFGAKASDLSNLAQPTTIASDNKELNTDQIKTFAQLGYAVTPGMTMGELKKQPIPVKASDNNKELDTTQITALNSLGYKAKPGMTWAEAKQLPQELPKSSVNSQELIKDLRANNPIFDEYDKLSSAVKRLNDTYHSAVDENGNEIKGKDFAQVDATLKAIYNEINSKGVGQNFTLNIPILGKLFSGGDKMSSQARKTMIEAANTALNSAYEQASQKLDTIIAKDPRYANFDKSLALESVEVPLAQASSARVGAIISLPDGRKAKKSGANAYDIIN